MGLKSDFWEGRFRFNLAMFRNDFKDKQESSVQVDPRTRTVSTKFDNVADARYLWVFGRDLFRSALWP